MGSAIALLPVQPSQAAYMQRWLRCCSLQHTVHSVLQQSSADRARRSFPRASEVKPTGTPAFGSGRRASLAVAALSRRLRACLLESTGSPEVRCDAPAARGSRRVVF